MAKSGMEMMLIQVFKGLGIDAEAIGKLAGDMQGNLDTMLAQQSQILKNQRRIMRHLEIPFAEEREDNDHGSDDNGTVSDAA